MENETKHLEKFVVLEHLILPKKGIRFWSMNTKDNTHGHNGGLWYKEILFTDNEDTATKASELTGELPSSDELNSYYYQLYKNRDNRG